VETKQTINNSCTTLLMDQNIEQERSLGKKMTWEHGECVNQNHEAGAPNTEEPSNKEVPTRAKIDLAVCAITIPDRKSGARFNALCNMEGTSFFGGLSSKKTWLEWGKK
jgi:hypothetical protein